MVGNKPLHNAYLDECWGNRNKSPRPKGDSDLQIAVQRVFEAMYRSKWKSKLRNTPCFNLIPVSSNGTGDPKLDKIWDVGVDWSIELLEYLIPRFIILYGNGKTGKSVWRALEQKLYLTEDKTPIDLVPITFKLYRGVLQGGILKGVPVLGLPHLSYIHRSSKRTSKNLETLCHRLSELAAQHPFP